MKVYKLIDKQKKIIKQLKNELPYSKNRIKDAERINSLIDVVNAFDSILVSKYKIDALETLIYSLFYELLIFYKAYENEIPIYEIVRTIDSDIFYGSELKKKQVISILKAHELNNKIKNNSVFDKNYTNFDKLLSNLINEIKLNILWKK